MRTTLFVITSLFLVLTSCQTEKYSLDNLPSRQLVFGSGGGFTGEKKSYILLENGQLFYTNSLTKEFKPLPSVSKKRARHLFKKAIDLKLKEMDFNHPGNIYYFIKLQDDTIINTLTWGSNEQKVPTAIHELYNELNGLRNTD